MTAQGVLAGPPPRAFPRTVATKRGPLHFGEKVRVILRRNLRAVPRVEPSTPLALAEIIGEPNPKVYRALANGKPKLDIAVKIARALGESLDFLANPALGLEHRSEGDRFDSFSATLTPAERDALADVVSRGLRPLLAAHQAATRGGRAGLSATPT